MILQNMLRKRKGQSDCFGAQANLEQFLPLRVVQIFVDMLRRFFSRFCVCVKKIRSGYATSLRHQAGNAFLEDYQPCTPQMLLLHKKQCRKLLTAVHWPAKSRVLTRQFTRC